MKIEPDKLQMNNGGGAHLQGDSLRLPDHAQINNSLNFRWGREGLHIDQAGREIAVVDCLDLALLKIHYLDNLDTTPTGWFITPRQKVLKWLKTQNQNGGILG